jgi:hypothetical protein
VAQKQKKDSVVNAINAALYRFFFKFAPFLAGGQNGKALVFIYLFIYIFFKFGPLLAGGQDRKATRSSQKSY